MLRADCWALGTQHWAVPFVIQRQAIFVLLLLWCDRCRPGLLQFRYPVEQHHTNTLLLLPSCCICGSHDPVHPPHSAAHSGPPPACDLS